MPTSATLLTELPLFASLRPEEREQLAQAVEVRRLAAGEALFRTGDPGQALYVVASGRMELSVTDHAGQKIVLTHSLPGDVFGELALLDAGPRSATAAALEPSELLELDREDLLLLVSQRPEAALHLLGSMGAMTRKADLLLRRRVARNAGEEAEDRRSLLERITDWVADFSGSLTFLLLNAAWFVVWIGLNVSGAWRFDPYPFGFLTMVVSLEAIILSILVLLSQNRQAAKDRIRDDVEYDINVKAEMEVGHLHEKVEEIREEMRVRFQALEALLRQDGGRPRT